MKQKQALDDELKKLALDWAEKVYNCMYRALSDPTVGMGEETTKIYKEFKDWGLFDLIGIDDVKAHEFYLRVIAIPKYRQLLYERTHPQKSKWEVVTGKALKKN